MKPAPLHLLLVVLFSTIAPLRAALIINMFESGSNVVTTISGSINNLTGTTSLGTAPDLISSYIKPDEGIVAFGSGVSKSYNLYTGFSATPANYGTGSGRLADSSSVSSEFFFRSKPDTRMFFLPTSYVLGTAITGTATYSNKSFTSLGITPGTYVWTWTGDSVTLNIGGSAPIPEPGTWAAAALLAGGAAFARWRKRAKVS